VSFGVNAKPAAVLAAIQPIVSQECVTPLGDPVLPEVKKIKAGAAGSTAGSSMAGSSLAIMASKLAGPSLPAP
jgi:hypothetical protein